MILILLFNLHHLHPILLLYLCSLDLQQVDQKLQGDSIALLSL